MNEEAMKDQKPHDIRPKRTLISLLLTFGLAFGGASLAQTIDYFSFTAGSAQIDALEHLIEVFEEENPGITVNYNTADFGSYFTKLQTDFAAGNAPDVFELNYENFVTFASRDTLLPLGDYLANSENISESTFYPAALDAFSRDGNQYGLPITFSTVLLFYNQDMFDEAGVGYPDEDWTWDDVLSAAEQLTDEGNRVWGIHQPVQFWEFYKAAAQAGGGLTVSPEVQIDSPENREALHYLVDKQLEHGVMPSAAQMSGAGDTDLFANQQLGMILTGIWMFDFFIENADFNWDVAVEPGGAQKATHFFSNAAVVSSQTEEAEAAYKWVEFLAAHPETVATRIDESWELSALSLEEGEAVAAYLEQPVPANREAVFESLRYAVVPPVLENQQELTDIVNQELEAALLGQKSVEDALAEAQRRVEALVD